MVKVCPEAGGRGADKAVGTREPEAAEGAESRRSEQVHQPPSGCHLPCATASRTRPTFRVQFGRKSAICTHSRQVYSSRPFIFKALEGHHQGPERLKGRRTQLFARQSRGNASKMNLILLLGFTQRQAQPKSLCNCLQLTPKHRRPGSFGPADLEVESGTNESSDDCSAVKHTRIPPLPSGTQGDG